MILGIDIGGTTIKYALVDTDYTIQKEWTIDTFEHKDSSLFYDALVENMGTLEGVDEIAISAPGVIAEDSTISSFAAPRVQVMYGTNCNKEVGTRTNLPVTTMNDAKAAGYAEYKIGAAQGTKSSVAFIIGTGVGGCIIENGEIINGVDGYGAEFSRIPVFVDGSIQILAQVCSATSLVDFYNKFSGASTTKAYDVFQRFYEEDEHAIKAMDTWINYIAVALIQLVAIVNPEVICIGGGVTQDEGLMDRINAKFTAYASLFFAQPALSTKVVRAQHLTNSNLLGAVIKAHETNN